MIKKQLMGAVLCGLLFSVVNLHAEDRLLDFNRQIKQLKKAKKVSIILSKTPQTVIGNTKEQSKDELLPLDGCYYFVTDSSKIGYLISNFKQLNIQSTSQEKSFLPHANISIRFDFVNNQQVQMLMGDIYPNETTVDGELYVSAQSAPQTFVINRMVHRDIRRWLITHAHVEEPTSCGHPSNCKELAEYCRSEIKVDFFRSNQKQTCKIEEFYRSSMPDYCESGWQPSYNVKEGE